MVYQEITFPDFPEATVGLTLIRPLLVDQVEDDALFELVTSVKDELVVVGCPVVLFTLVVVCGIKVVVTRMVGLSVLGVVVCNGNSKYSIKYFKDITWPQEDTKFLRTPLHPLLKL